MPRLPCRIASLLLTRRPQPGRDASSTEELAQAAGVLANVQAHGGARRSHGGQLGRLNTTCLLVGLDFTRIESDGPTELKSGLGMDTPIEPRHSKYRVAKLWSDLPEGNPPGLSRRDGDWQQMRLGTVHHEIWEGQASVPVIEEQMLSIRISCIADTGKILEPVKFALCVSLEEV